MIPIMRDRLRTLWPKVSHWLFIATVTGLVISYGLLNNDDLPERGDRFEYITSDDYAEMLKQDPRNTKVIDVRIEHTQKDVHANALVQGVAYEEMGRKLADQADELRDKNLVFM